MQSRILIFLIILLTGFAFTPTSGVFAQVHFGGKIMQWVPSGAVCPPIGVIDPLGRWCGVPYHVISPPRPSTPTGVLCPLCMGPAGVGRWFLGTGIFGLQGMQIIRGALGGL